MKVLPRPCGSGAFGRIRARPNAQHLTGWELHGAVRRGDVRLVVGAAVRRSSPVYGGSMTLGIAIVLTVLVATIALFLTERLPVDIVALLAMVVLIATRSVSPEEGISGFGHPATVTVAALFVLSAGLSRTGALNALARGLTRIGRRSSSGAVFGLMLVAGTASAFVNNTAAVAVLMPIAVVVARDAKISPSKLLMPLSYAAIFGGTCTLIGTSTNVLVSSIAERHGQRPFTMFELAPLGGALFAAGILYMSLVGVRLIPPRIAAGDLVEDFKLADYLTEIVLLPGAPSVGRRLADSPLIRDLEVAVLEIVRDGERILIPDARSVLHEGDVIRVRCDVNKIRELKNRAGISLRPHDRWRDSDLQSPATLLVEAVLAPNADLAGKTIREARFRDEVGGVVLAIRHRGDVMQEHVEDTRLRAGDALLIDAARADIERFKRNRNFVVVSEVTAPAFRRRKAVASVLIFVGVVLAATAGVLPIAAAAVAGAVLTVVSGCLSGQEAYRAVEWKVIFLMAGVLALGTALENTGAAQLIAGGMVSLAGSWGPLALVSAFYVMTSLLTEAMSNVATAAVMAPIAIASARALGVDSRPFLIAVTFAASASFMTPVGYQTNTLVYGPGGYRFADFLRVGAPLNLVFWLLATLLIPHIWPF